MALAILSQPGEIQPVYSIQKYELYDAVRAGNAGLYYQLDITIDGETRYIKQLPDENKKAIIDVQTILQSFFESNIVVHDSLLLDNSSGLKSYDIVAHSYVGATDSSVTVLDKWVFNGVDLYNRMWDADNYIFDGDGSNNFLTKWTSPREIHLGDDLFVQFLQGDFGTYESDFTGLEITKYDFNGDTSTHEIILSLSTDPSILSMNIGPNALNVDSSISIDSSTQYYIVKELGGDSVSLRVNLVTSDTRYDEYYRFYYTGSLGETEAFNFDLTPSNTIGISKVSYVNDRTQRAFGTTVRDSYVATSNWMCEETSENLKELWITPKAELYLNEIYIPIIITESSKQILNRKNQKLINYTIAYSYAEEYSVQAQ